MKIGIDIRSLASGRRSGVEEYVLRVCEELFDQDSENEYVLFVSGLKAHIQAYDFDSYTNVSVVHVRFPNKILNASFRFLNYPKIDALLGGVDVLFFPNILFSAVSRKVPYIVTLHDLSFNHFSEFLTLKKKLWHFFVRPFHMAQNAAKVLTVSHASREDILNTYKMDKEKVTVIESGVVESGEITEKKRQIVKEKYGLPDKCILCFGTVEPRKNIEGLIDAFSLFKKTHPEYSLVIAGSDGWKMKDLFKNALTKVPKDSILFTGFVDEDDKLSLYSLADIFVFLTHFEGFGFPLLEAASVNVPIIASSHSSLFEIIGNGALLVDPSNAHEVSLAMKSLADSASLRNEYALRAQKQLKRYSVKNAARELLNQLTYAYEKER